LQRHRAALLVKRGKLDRMLASIDAAIAIEKGTVMEVRALFDGFDHAEEAEQRWGDTESYKESARRTKRYGKAEWDAIRSEGDAVFARFAELMAEGAAPADARVRDAVIAHRDHITRWFYPCSVEMQRGLAEMFVADVRFTQNIDRVAAGLARYIHAAITA
jgi:MerR family transcriptional regulator, thiopeptide resistance regulator